MQRPVPAEAWQAMADAVQPNPLRFGFVGTDQAEALKQHRAIAAEAWRIELVTPRTIMESYKVLRVGAAEIAQHRDGLSLMDPMVVLMDRVGLFDRSKAPAPDDFATTSQIEDFGSKLASTPGFLWMVTDGNDRVTQVNAGRAYARVQLAATAHGVAMQPLQQALQEYPEQARPYAEIRQLLGAPQPAQTVQMWARVGYAPPVAAGAAARCRRDRDRLIRAPTPCRHRATPLRQSTHAAAPAATRRPKRRSARPATAAPPRRASSPRSARCSPATASAESASTPWPSRPASTRC